MVTGELTSEPLLTTFCVRTDPSLFSTLTLPDDGMNAIGVMPQISNPRTSCSPPMNVRENGGTYFPPYPVTLEAITWNARMLLLCQGPCGSTWHPPSAEGIHVPAQNAAGVVEGNKQALHPWA